MATITAEAVTCSSPPEERRVTAISGASPPAAVTSVPVRMVICGLAFTASTTSSMAVAASRWLGVSPA